MASRGLTLNQIDFHIYLFFWFILQLKKFQLVDMYLKWNVWRSENRTIFPSRNGAQPLNTKPKLSQFSPSKLENITFQFPLIIQITISGSMNHC